MSSPSAAKDEGGGVITNTAAATATGSSNSSSSSSPCAICLDPLASSTPLGACSCGHVFHATCFLRWKTSSQQMSRWPLGGGGNGGSNRTSDDIKCPVCNQIVLHFTQLFWQLPAAAASPLVTATTVQPRTATAAVAKEEEEKTTTKPLNVAEALTNDRVRLTRSCKRKAMERIKKQQQQQQQKKSKSSNSRRITQSTTTATTTTTTTTGLYGYMDRHPQLEPFMREVLVDWLLEVHENFKHGPETLYAAIQILDAYLASSAGHHTSTTVVVRSKFQLVGVSCYALASKFKETQPCHVKDCVYICAGQYTEQDVRVMEQCILKTLQHDILEAPTAYTRLVRMILLNTSDSERPKMMNLSRYLLDSTLLSYELLQYVPSQMAAAVVYICRRTFLGAEASGGWDNSTANHESSSSSSTLTTEETIRPIARAVLDAKAKLTKLDGLRKKHSTTGAFETVFPCDL
eukprot:scaffold336_cov196-Amphora_coffeaeformis.AAC.30